VDKKNQLDVTFVFFICFLLVAQHVSGNHVPWLQEGCQVRLAGSASIDGFVARSATQSLAPDDGHFVARNMLSN